MKRNIETRKGGKEFHAWGDPTGDKTSEWRISEDGSVIATIQIEMERYRKEDMTGWKQFKIVSKAHRNIKYRVAYQTEIEFEDDWFFYGGEVASIRDLIKTFSADNWPIWVQMEVENQCRKAGISNRVIMGAIYDGNPSRKPGTIRLARMLKEIRNGNNGNL